MITRKTQQANSLPVLYEGSTVRVVQVWTFFPDYRGAPANQLIATLDNQGGVTLQEMASDAESVGPIVLDSIRLGQLLAAREAYLAELGGSWRSETDPYGDDPFRDPSDGDDETDEDDYPY